jgi:ferredoxin-type protein NapH
MGFSIKRIWVQAVTAVAQNGWLAGFARGTVYKGRTKYACLPGLNCYSCPGALASCPIGSLQAVLNSWKYNVSLYVTGTLLLFGLVAGRWICGWLCPFGLLEDVLYRIPGRKVKVPSKLRWLRFTRYAVLLVLVILLPMLVVNFAGLGEPWFCKYVCPSGTIFGALPLMAVNSDLRAAAGLLFAWKVGLALAIVAVSVIIYRFFCRFICPLGAVYGLMNRLALYRMHVEKQSCDGCGACANACKLDIDPRKTPNSPDCIRCGDCLKACPHSALCMKFHLGERKYIQDPHPLPPPRAR